MNRVNVESTEPCELTSVEVDEVSGGLRWKGHRMSDNVEDVRGCTPMDIYINPGSGRAHSCTNPRFRN